MSDVYYEATVSYDVEMVPLLDRNISRVAKACSGRLYGAFSNTGFFRGRQRRLAYTFKSKLNRLRFIQAMRKFLKTADFGVKISVERVGER